VFECIDLSYRGNIKIIGEEMSKIGNILIVVVLIMSTISGVKPAVALEYTEIDTAEEYMSGYLQGLWYTWINTMGTQVIFIAMHEEKYNSPVFAFFGQCYNSTANSRIFVGNALSLMEIYNDTNGNGILDANYTAGASELKYYLAINSSKVFNAASVQKMVTDGIIHYKWGVKYEMIDGFLLYLHPDEYGYGWGEALATVSIDHIGLFFDYSIEQNITYLKTTFQIGNTTILERANSDVIINGLSLSLLFTTQVISPKNYTIIVNEGLFDSTRNSTLPSVNLAKVRIENITAYEFIFGDNYTLYELPIQYPAEYSACPTDSVQSQIFKSIWLSPLWRVETCLQEILPEIGNFTTTLSLNFTTSSFIYRIAYPQWSGGGIKHDPTYVSFITSKTSTYIFPVEIEIVTLVALTGIIALIVALNEFRKIRNILGSAYKNTL
jgi:hypothetical protein